MQKRSFTTRHGHTLDLSRLGLGTAPIGDLFEYHAEREVCGMVAHAHALGINLFDSSPHYGNGLAEARLGSGLRNVEREKYLISTKVGRVMDPFSRPAPPIPGVFSPGFLGGFPHQARFDYSYDGAMRSVEHSLLRMGVSQIDILLIHDVDVWTHGDGFEQRFKEAMDGAYRALDKLRAEGSVKAIGCGLNEADKCMRFAQAGDFDVMMMAGRYTLLEQDSLDTFLPLASAKSIGILLAGVYNSGILVTGAKPGARYNYCPAPDEIMTRVGKIERVCAAHHVALPAAALAFGLGHPAVLSAVLGAVKAEEVTANVALAETRIPAVLWSDLKSEGLMRADAPVQ